MSRRLALLGASGHGKVVADLAELAGWDPVVFFDDAWPSVQRNAHWPVAGDSGALRAALAEFDGVVVAIGHCPTRWRCQQALAQAGARLATLVHPSAVVSRHAQLGEGTVVMAGAVVQAGASIGPAGIINTGATVDHDVQLGPAVHVAPGAHLSGQVSVGAQSWIGVGAAVRQGIRIGELAMVGAGAVVVAEVADGATVVGNPARPKLRT